MKNILINSLAASFSPFSDSLTRRSTDLASSVPCQNARDATLAGTSTARFLLSTASAQAQGTSLAFSPDSATQANLTLAYSLLTGANVNLANLALSAANTQQPSSLDVQSLTDALKKSVVAVQAAQKAATLVSNGNFTILGSTGQSGQGASQGLTMNLALPLITINGPEVIVQQV
jgi:hypothetical protein